MKKLTLLLSILLSIFAVSSCDSVDFGDINEDDDAPQEANAEGLMAGAMNQYFTLTGSAHIIPTLYVQYQTQSVYTTAMRYGENPYPWSAYYSGVLSNFEQIKSLTTGDIDPITLEYGSSDNQRGVAYITSGLVWKRVTDTWGPAPFTEALNAENNKAPAYSDQETIYKGVIDSIKTGRDLLDSSEQGPTGDVIYGGDVTQWKKFANSLLLSMAIQLSDADPTYAEQEFNAALNHSAGVIETIEDEAWYIHENASGAENPFTAYRGSDYYLAEPFTRALEGIAQDSAISYSNDSYDDRLIIFSSDTSQLGAPYGEDNSGVDGPSISDVVSDADAPLPHLTAAYTYLNRAEAAELGWTSENAEDMFTTGIEMSYATLDVHYDDGDPTSGDLQSDGSTFANERLADATTDPNVSLLQVIGEEKWVALFPEGFSAWAEWRRTGYPGLVPAPDAVNDGDIPRRYIYPSTEPGVNTASYEDGVSKLTPSEDSNTSRFWWDL
jgi:hypothetical protein